MVNVCLTLDNLSLSVCTSYLQPFGGLSLGQMETKNYKTETPEAVSFQVALHA